MVGMLCFDASVPSLTEDSQIGANPRGCADEKNRADCDQHGRSRTIGATVPGPKHAAEGGLESTDRAAGERWADGGGDCCGGWQESADRPPLAPSLCGERRGRAAEGRDPTTARQAAAVRKDQAGGAHDAARETAERD